MSSNNLPQKILGIVMLTVAIILVSAGIFVYCSKRNMMPQFPDGQTSLAGPSFGTVSQHTQGSIIVSGGFVQSSSSAQTTQGYPKEITDDRPPWESKPLEQYDIEPPNRQIATAPENTSDLPPPPYYGFLFSQY